MIPTKIRFLVLVAGIAACGDRAPKPVSMHEAMPFLPLPPGAIFVEKRGGPDALQITLRSPAKADSVATYYRRVLQRGGWRLVSDQTDRDGATVLFAEKKGPPLWIRVQQEADSNGSLIQVAGAVTASRDSARVKPAS
jgi:hypothetical protein